MAASKMKKKKDSDPVVLLPVEPAIEDWGIQPSLNRHEVAKVLNCSPLTVANREKSGVYPTPRRDSNNYRYYLLRDVFYLQYLTEQVIDITAIAAVLWDKHFWEDASLVSFLSLEVDIFKTLALPKEDETEAPTEQATQL